jgi:hypothetical protein
MPSALHRVSKGYNEIDLSYWRDPTIAELLSDPLVKAMMKADGVSRRKLEELVNKVMAQRMANKLIRSTPRGAKAG